MQDIWADFGRKWRVVMAARRKCEIWPDFSCDCGADKDSHKFVLEITGLQCTVVLRCPDGQLTVY